jgi:TonB family protein
MQVRFAMEHAFTRAVMDSMSAGGPKSMTVRVVYDVYIDPTGEVTDIQVAESTGDEALDADGLEAARRARFTQALQGDCGVGVWMQLPMMLRVGVGGDGSELSAVAPPEVRRARP